MIDYTKIKIYIFNNDFLFKMRIKINIINNYYFSYKTEIKISQDEFLKSGRRREFKQDYF